MIKRKFDIRKIKTFLPVPELAKPWRAGFGPPVRLVQLLEKNRIMRGIVNRHFYNYSLLSPAAMKMFFSSAAAERQLSRIYENFYQKKLETERHYYRSKPTMAYKMLKTFFDYDYRKETELVYRLAPQAPAVNQPPAGYETRESERGVRVIERGKAAGLTAGDLAMITERVLAALTRQRLWEERRNGR